RVVSQNVLEALEAMARNVDSSFGRLHALWTLEGIGRLRPEVIKAAIHDPESGVRENAIRLAELHLENAPDLGEVLVQLNNEPNARVRFQLLLTLGYIDTPEAAALRQTLLFSDLS